MLDPVTRLDPEYERMTEQAAADYAYSLLGECEAVRVCRSLGIEPRYRPELVELEKAGEVYRKAHETACTKAAAARAGVKAKPQMESAPAPESVTPSTLLRLKDAARLGFPSGSGVTDRTLYNEIAKGILPRREFGGKLWLTLSDINEAMMRNTCDAQNPAGDRSQHGSTSANQGTAAKGNGHPRSQRQRAPRRDRHRRI
jgi:hypothetical protein